VNTNKTIAIPFAFAALALFAQVRLAAQTWETVDDFQYILGKSSTALGLAADNLGNVYVAGYGLDAANVRHALLMRSSDQGVSWQIVDDYNYGVGTTTELLNIRPDPAGNLLTVGYALVGSAGPTGRGHWLVRKSADHGATWQTIDDFSSTNGSAAFPTSIAADSSGNLYTAGYVMPFSGPQRGIALWVVRESSDGGATWSTVDVFQYSTLASTLPVGIASTPAGVFVAGFGGLHWFVRQSVNAGQSWSIADDFLYPNVSGSAMYGFTADTAGNVYTCGGVSVAAVTKKSSTTQNYFVVRKAVNGASWQTVDTEPNPWALTSFETGDFGMGSDAAGNIYAAGKGVDGQWLVQKSANQGTGWSVADDFAYGTASQASGYASDGLGNVYVCGNGTGTMGSRWLVRKAMP